MTDDYLTDCLTNPMVPMEYRNVIGAKVVIEKHVIVGASSIILPGVTLKEGSSFGTLSLINKDSIEWSVNVGIPSKYLKDRQRRSTNVGKKLTKEKKQKMKINVTRSSLPDFNTYVERIKTLWDTRHLTNIGKFHLELEQNLSKYLSVDNTLLYTNGHIALEYALDVIKSKGEIITTPFTFASTTQAIIRTGNKPVFCDIKDDFTIDENKIEALITDKTVAIVPVHVYGNICNVDKIDEIAKKKWFNGNL